MNNPIIVALDDMDHDETRRVAARLRGMVAAFKVNDLVLRQGMMRRLARRART